jgi:methionine sulfoxide reductase heme-binding subunit
MAHLVLADTATLWYVTRTLGIAAYITLVISCALGMLRVTARRSGEQLNWLVDEMHMFVASVSGVLVLGHIVALYFDPFLPFSLVNLLLPLPSQPYRTLAVNLGVLSFYCVVALLLSSWARRRLAYGIWRNVHNLSIVLLVLVTLHGWLAGSDAGEPWMKATYGAVMGSFGFLILWRLFFTVKRRGANQEEALDVPLGSQG